MSMLVATPTGLEFEPPFIRENHLAHGVWWMHFYPIPTDYPQARMRFVRDWRASQKQTHQMEEVTTTIEEQHTALLAFLSQSTVPLHEPPNSLIYAISGLLKCSVVVWSPMRLTEAVELLGVDIPPLHLPKIKWLDVLVDFIPQPAIGEGQIQHIFKVLTQANRQDNENDAVVCGMSLMKKRKLEIKTKLNPANPSDLVLIQEILSNTLSKPVRVTSAVGLEHTQIPAIHLLAHQSSFELISQDPTTQSESIVAIPGDRCSLLRCVIASQAGM